MRTKHKLGDNNNSETESEIFDDKNQIFYNKHNLMAPRSSVDYELIEKYRQLNSMQKQYDKFTTKQTLNA